MKDQPGGRIAGRGVFWNGKKRETERTTPRFLHPRPLPLFFVNNTHPRQYVDLDDVEIDSGIIFMSCLVEVEEFHLGERGEIKVRNGGNGTEGRRKEKMIAS